VICFLGFTTFAVLVIIDFMHSTMIFCANQQQQQKQNVDNKDSNQKNDRELHNESLWQFIRRLFSTQFWVVFNFTVVVVVAFMLIFFQN
jgi:disulfide bond formation protein DsbB